MGIDETEWVKNKKNVGAFVIFTQMVGENGKSTHLQKLFNHLDKNGTNSPTFY